MENPVLNNINSKPPIIFYHTKYDKLLVLNAAIDINVIYFGNYTINGKDIEFYYTPYGTDYLERGPRKNGSVLKGIEQKENIGLIQKKL